MPENGDRIRLFVVHRNQPAACAATVRALLDQNVPLNVSVIDNDSALAAYDDLRVRLGPEIEMVRLAENKGWGPALNIVLRKWLETEPESFCLISAHDAVPAPDCLELLIGATRNDPKIGIACPQYPDATLARLSARRGVWQDIGTPLPRGTVQYVDAPHGTLFLLRRECLAQIGLFDERYFAYGDEHELGARAVEQGWKVGLVWGAVVTNPGTWTSTPLRSYFFTRNSLMLVRDYFGVVPAAIRAVLILLNTLRMIVRSPGEAFAFSGKARCRAVCDYFLKRYGLPKWAE